MEQLSFDPQALRCVALLPVFQPDRVREPVRQVTRWFRSRNIKVLLPQAAADDLEMFEIGAARAALAEADLLLSLGGDGTLLSAARLAAPRGKPVLGINLGGFGFLAALPQEGLLDHLARIMEGDFVLQPRMMLQAQVQRGGKVVASFLALNDIVIARGAFSRLFRLTTRISGDMISTFPADGMIVATPTGSTGYALSAGGPVLAPELRAFVITPICAHTLSARTLVAPVDRPVTLSLPDQETEEVRLTADGQEGMPLQPGDCVEITEAPFSARLLFLPDETFYDRLRDKLGWGGPR